MLADGEWAAFFSPLDGVPGLSMQSDDFGSEFASWVCSRELGSDAVLPRTPLQGMCKCLLKPGEVFLPLPCSSLGAAGISLRRYTEGETTSWRAYAKGERHIPKQFILAAGFCCPFWFGGLVVFGCFFFPCFSFSSFDGNFSDSLTLQFIKCLGISWLPPSRESGVIPTGSWHGCCALWLWGSALQLGQPGVEPDVPSSEELPLWKPEAPAAHAEAMVHFQRRLPGRVTKHQARPSNPSAAMGRPPGSLPGSCPAPTDHSEVGQRGHCGQGRCGRRNILVWRMVMGSPVVGHRSKLSFLQSRGGISESKWRFNLLYPLSLSFILISTTSAFLHPQAVSTAAQE